MKRTFYALTVAVTLLPGCIPESFLHQDAPEKSAPKVTRLPGRPHNYVGPDQVDEQNCREKERALRQELEQDEMEPAKPATPPKR
ncbi:MAG TPA: hypothetical protein VKE94_16815 [Gemmataceae bacterium]|nr:hypothetical protein [Gemmataceae bacterium]